MRNFRSAILSAVLGLAGALGFSAAHGATVTCGNASLGIRVTSVTPGNTSGLCYAGLSNLGNPALESLLASLTGDPSAEILDRDNANSNGGLLSITGVGSTNGTWSFTPALWNDYQRLFLYFHFGDAQDDPGPTSPTDPDIFIVELLRPDASGDWEFGPAEARLTGLSNIALMRTGSRNGGGPGNGGGNGVPEPATLGLIGLGMLAIGALRRRRSDASC